MKTSSGIGRTHSASRLIRAAPATIYRAFMSPEATAAWRPPEGMRARIFEFDPREGGVFRMALEYESEAHDLPGKSSEHADVVKGRFGALAPAAGSSSRSSSSPTIPPLPAR